ncbi:type II toxin-antitoxin system ParD family antitoxin [Mycolicibacterium sp. XJ870]
MGKNTSFSLDEHYSAFIEEEVASGRYGSASDVVRSALRLLEDRETRLRALRLALIAGEQSGESTPPTDGCRPAPRLTHAADVLFATFDALRDVIWVSDT